MRPVVPALVAAAVLVLGGCGGSDSGPHNAADVRFAQQMVPHHSQALEMVELTEGRDLDPDVQELVDGIESSQSQEVATMTGWLKGWGEKVPTSMSEPMNGMLSGDQLTRLRDTDDDVAFQRLWLLDMTQHHQGAIPMAQTEVDDGADPSAIRLAKDIIRVQEQELGVMGGLISQ